MSAPQWIIVAVIIAVLSVGWFWGAGMWWRPRPNPAAALERAKADAEARRRTRTTVVTAAQLLQDFQNDPAAADQKYRGRYLEISGVVERSGRDGDDNSFVVLNAGDEHAPLKIECFFELADEPAEVQIQIQRLRKGRTVTVRGEYRGRVSNVQIRECALAE
jgi:hypothetical protein